MASKVQRKALNGSKVLQTNCAEKPLLGHCYTEPAKTTQPIDEDVTVEGFSKRSRKLSIPSSTTSTNFTIDTTLDITSSARSRPSIFRRLKSSISAVSQSPPNAKRPSVHPSDFGVAPDQPEKHFIDSIGMVIPGVCNRDLCEHPLAHFVTNWRLCEPTEYTTALADHGITHADHWMLLAALLNFLDDVPHEGHLIRKPKSEEPARSLSVAQFLDPPTYTVTESALQYKLAEKQAKTLDKLLEDISWNWQKRGVPVMVCVGSYSLFTPNRISEAVVQILHVSLQRESSPPLAPADPRVATRLSFIDPFSIADEERSVAGPRHKMNRRSTSPASPTPWNDLPHHYKQQQLRDRTRPWPLWPNAIPSQKRELMNDHADRYGVDPYFRAWMRANINSGTKSTSYAKYMIEQEDNPFINKRLHYTTPPSRSVLLWRSLTVKSKQRNEQASSKVNRETYEHNRKLEVRKTVEHGSRLRIARFGFRHPIYPPHTPEMEELGLTKDAYRAIIRNIEDLRKMSIINSKGCIPGCFAPWRKIRHRSTEDALTKVSEYVRHINAADRRIVWTIEKIPGVYEQGLGRNKKEWEISAWNGEDPLELLIQLEKWGIIERRLGIDDDE
ncbi:hypothetical protein P280DRAFT_533664 [Massarina eburnea CBS 473.64]|uniref:Uncharacterized protein n=1 Tax=Massarina eburnea CBS 473.64 TaxID=1395130 RepID=A0A6A6RMG7_9PLEO|nr:hypothetical protein P280DRAFT_533664 [Massarina eburnea CBS 473.64]